MPDAVPACIDSHVKQPALSFRARCFASPRNDDMTSGAPRHSRAAIASESLQVAPQNQRAQGMPGASAAPAALRADKESTQASHRRSAEHVRHSPRGWFYGLWRALPGEPGLLSPSPASSSSRRLDISVGISGPHAFAVRDKRIRLLRRRVHRIFRPTFSDDRETPLLGRAEDARRSARDLPVVASERPATD